MCLAVRVLFVLEQRFQFLQGKVLFGVLLHVYHISRQALLTYLTLINFLLNRARAEQAINKHPLFLSITPDTTHRLCIVGRVSVWVKENETIGTNQV